MLYLNRFLFVPYSTSKMFNIVNNVNDYSHFLPGCNKSDVLDSSNNHMIALIDFSQSGFHSTFITYNYFVHNTSIDIKLIKGPFRQLLGSWNFIELEDNLCKVIFNLEFEFNNIFTHLSFKLILQEVIDKIIHIFSLRAQKIYGNKNFS